MIKLYCECCGEHTTPLFEDIIKDDYNKNPWGEIVCKECGFVMGTMEATKQLRGIRLKGEDET